MDDFWKKINNAKKHIVLVKVRKIHSDLSGLSGKITSKASWKMTIILFQEDLFFIF